jgi:hypothetical protein
MSSNELIIKLDSNTSYEYFYNEFLVKNIICLFDKELTQNWKSRREWLTSNGRPNLDFLDKTFGKLCFNHLLLFSGIIKK